MIKQLNWEETCLLKKSLEEEKYLNLFFLNNMENLKFNKEYHVYGNGSVFFMNYKETSMLCFATGPYDAEEAYAFLMTQTFQAMNGAKKYLDPLVPYFCKTCCIHNSELMYVNRETFRKLPERSDNLRLLLAPEDFEKVAHLYKTSEDFNLDLGTEEELEDWACDMAEREYPFAASGYFVKKRLVACGYLSAYTKKSAMVVGVYVHPDFQNGGIGTQLVSELTDLALNENRIGYLCLFYSTEKAKHVYEKLGYQVCGDYLYIKK